MTLEFNRKRIDVRLFVYPLTTRLKDMLPMLLVLLLSVYVNLVKELFLRVLVRVFSGKASAKV